jgi:hypothetical protein
MGFKRNNDTIGTVLEQNRKKQQDEKVFQTPINRQKKVRETTKSYNFTLRPSVREKLNVLRDYDDVSDATSAAGYLSDLIENRYSELGLDK